MEGGPRSTGVAFERGLRAFAEGLPIGVAVVVGADVRAWVAGETAGAAGVAGATVGVAVAAGMAIKMGVADGVSDHGAAAAGDATAGSWETCGEVVAGRADD